MSKEVMEVILDDLLALDFGHAQELGMETESGNYERLNNLAFCLGRNGELYINKSFPWYPGIKDGLVLLHGVATEEIEQQYTQLAETYPNDYDVRSIEQFKDVKDRALIVTKIIMKMELEKREIGHKNIQQILRFFTIVN